MKKMVTKLKTRISCNYNSLNMQIMKRKLL